MIKGPGPRWELAALKFVAQHTSIPVPKVFNSYHHGGFLYIEKEVVRGVSLEAAWQRGYLSQEQKTNITAEIGGYIGQLRKLEPPRKEIVASADLDDIMDHRVGCDIFGPFMTHQGFHLYIRANLSDAECNEAFGAGVTECHSRHYRSYFTHADLAPRNIMVGAKESCCLQGITPCNR
ncbi:hypothetical protein N7492_005975 [Penicillium capsulatum]|uniref:Aminoglycoside phosphotransferase domain-containing protein n=1 Tax=Penicillium capsulatum TaxID=69766 RepID=A0A9W9LRN0_9EURO|nr:hypothetical protein N7492_005975 [Penicillium capsulatum]KAJ6134921.1 hypothetical protein N7512_000081 [Penicillium capsulatum]